jgi:exosortase
MKNKYYRLSIFIILAILAGMFIYKAAIIQVISAVIHREGSSHGIFVPFVSLYFIWLKRDIIRDIKPQFDYLGVTLIIIGGIVPLFHMINFQLRFLCFIVFFAGLFFTFFGRNFFKEISFPIFFLITMIPIPENVYQTLANYTRHISFNGSLKIISLLGIPYFKQGWSVQFPNAVLKVAIACSGIRYLISYFVFGIAYAWLYKTTVRRMLLIILLTIPISLFASILRLTAIFIMTDTFGPRMAEHWPHIIISWIVFFTILLASIAMDQYFQKRRYTRILGGREAGMLEG